MVLKYSHLVSCFLLLLLASCGSIDEEIIIDNAGGGSFVMKADIMESTVEMSFQMMKGFIDDENLNEDSLREALVDEMWESMPNDIDSTIDIMKGLPDSIKNNPEYLNILNRTEGFMKSNRKKREMEGGISHKFSNISDLNAFISFLDKQNDNPTTAKFMKVTKSKSAIITFAYDGKTFSRTSVPKEGGNSNENSESSKEIDTAVELMFKDAYYRIRITMPKTIASANGPGLIEVKGKQAFFEYSMSEYMNAKANTDFEITLK